MSQIAISLWGFIIMVLRREVGRTKELENAKKKRKRGKKRLKSIYYSRYPKISSFGKGKCWRVAFQGDFQSHLSRGVRKERLRSLMRFPEPYLPCAVVVVTCVLIVLSSEALSSCFGSQQGKNEQETTSYRGSSFQGIVEYLFRYLAPILC